MIYPYSVPAILALIGKIIILIFSRRSSIKNFQTRLFEAAVAASLVFSLAEVSGLQRIFDSSPRYEGVIYLASSVLLVALLAHLAITVSYDHSNKKSFYPLYFLIYSYALVLEYLLLFSSQVISGIEDFNGYSMTASRGPRHWLYETFIVLGVLIILLAPLGALSRKKVSGRRRNQCKLWSIAAAPIVLLVIAIVVLLNFKIRLINATVTTPLLITLFLAAVGYIVHRRNIVEVDFYLPWGKTRRSKMALYTKLAALNEEMPQVGSLEEIISRLSETLSCPVCFIGNQATQSAPPETPHPLQNFPIEELRKIDRMITADRVQATSPQLHRLMAAHRVAAIVPFYPGSTQAASWLLLGQPFDQRVFSYHDFKVIGNTFAIMADLLLDAMLEAEAKKIGLGECEQPRKSLQDLVQEFEAEVIEAALNDCKGNQAQAARLLGLRPNTFYYKLKRYRLHEKLQRPSA